MDITKQGLVLEVAASAAVTRVDQPLPIAIYGAAPGERRPAVVFAFGFPAAVMERMLGRAPVEMQSYVDWAQLCAAAGAVAVTCIPRDPAADLATVLTHLRDHATELGIDPARIALWSCSGNVPVALDALRREGLSRAALLYGYMFGPQVEQVQPHIGFANPAAGATVSDLPPTLPLLVVRCGQDKTPLLNDTIDAFTSAALAANLPLTLINLPSAPHAFDMFDDRDRSRDVIRQIVAFVTA